MRDIEEVTVTFPPLEVKRKDKLDAAAIAKLKEEKRKIFADSAEKVLATVQEINAHPERYGRVGMPPLRANVVIGHGSAAKIQPLGMEGPAREEMAQ